MLEKVDKLMSSYIEELGDSHSLDLYKKLPHGKRLRAKLVLKIAQESVETIKLASVVELIHAASLLHDDVIDEADSRRGVDSINAIYGNKSAIMLGDILYSKAFFELTTLPNEIARSISNAVTMLSVGELLDVELSNEFNSNIDIYMDMIYKKTAVLIEASAKSAALISSKDSEAFALYGKNLGIAFQIVDDILDITSDSKTLGKPALNDFKEGKTTLPYIYLYEWLDDSGREKLLSLYKKELNSEEKSWIVENMKNSGAIDRAMQKAKELGSEAINAVDDISLKSIISDMIDREF